MALRLLRLKTFISLSMLLLLLSCNEKSDNEVYEKKASTGKLDATFAWLDKEENYGKANYMPVFYDYYQKILNKDIGHAAHVLEVVCSKKARARSFDKKFVNTINTFSNRYRSKIPVKKTLFINSYFTTLYNDKGDYKTAISYALKTISTKVTDYDSCRDIAYAYCDLSFCNFNIGNQDLAIKYNMQALTYFKKINHINGIGAVYNSLAGIYYTANNYPEAEKYYDKAIDCFKKAKDLDNVFIALYNKAAIYSNDNNKNLNALVESTYNYFNSSGSKSKDTKISVYTSYISSLLRQEKLKEAKKIIDEIEPVVREVNSTQTNMEFDVIVADYKLKNNEPIDTEKIRNTVIPYLVENQNYQRLKIYYLILKDNAVKRGDYKTAYEYEINLVNVSLDIGNEANSDKVIELDKKYQNAEKEKKIVTQERTIAKKNSTIAWLAFSILAALVIIVVYQSRQKQKKLKNEKQSAQTYTRQLLEKTEEERKRIASDLHDSVSHELLSLKNMFDEKTSVTNTKIDAIINDIRSISRNLHPVMFDKIGLKDSIRQLVDRAQSANNFMITAEMDYEYDLTSSVELQIYRIIQEAISNIIKYANAIASKISIWESKNKIHIEIKDNGQGFDVDETLNSSAAFGLHNIIERSRAIGGEAKIVSDKNGTIITIEIKKQ